MCEISASSWFYYKEIRYDARSHERKKERKKKKRIYGQFNLHQHRKNYATYSNLPAV